MAAENFPLKNFNDNIAALIESQKVVAYDLEISRHDIPTKIFHVESIVFIIWRQGSATLKIDLLEHKVRPGAVTILFPNNYVSLTESCSDLGLRFVACDRRMVENSLINSVSLYSIIARHKPYPVTVLSDDQIHRITDYYDFLSSRLDDPESAYKAPKIQALLQSALYEVFTCIEQAQASTAKPQSRKEILTSRFIVAVGEHFRENRFVNYYAGLLCVTAKHLDAVVKETSGKTPRVWIEDYVIMEAKILLQTTDLTIQEIAFKLNFANQSFFGKFFRQLTGYSPTAYRRLANGQ